MVDIIHRRAPHAPVVPFESQRLHKVHRRAKARAQPQHRTDISGNLGFE